MLTVNLYHHFAQPMESLVSLSQDAQLQLSKQVAFWELMEIVDGYQPLELPLLNVLYTHHAPLPKELQLHNAYFGDQLVFQMEHHASQRPHAHLTLHKSDAPMQELMEHASMLPQLVQPPQELADYNYVPMQQLQQHQVSQPTQDALDSQQQLLVQLQELDVFHKVPVDHTQPKQDVFKELMESASGPQQQQLQLQQHQLAHQAFAD